jgi:hypothetical protein
MAAYHHMLVHFPLALWTTAAIIIVFRAFSSRPLGTAAIRLLIPLLWLGNLFALFAYGSGMLVWSIDAVTHSPLGRNHVLFASWVFAYWVVVTVMLQRVGEAVWKDGNRWLMLLLATLGTTLLAVTGTLGGHLTGSATLVSELLGLLGWEVYTTFYLPLWMIVTMVIAAFLLAGMGFVARPERE